MEDSTPVEELQKVDEVTRLKRHIRTLMIKNEDLIDEMTESQDELDACHQTLHKISSLRKPFLHPPPEILHLIFERAIVPNFLINSSDSFLPYNLWCKVQEQKHALLNVCWAWYRIGLPFIYEVVAIRRTYQLPNLLRTLKTSSPNLNLKEMITAVEILCPVPAPDGEHFKQQLTVLFEICPRISSCSFVSQRPPFELPLTIPQCALLPNIKKLELHKGIEIGILQDIIQLASPYIVSLSFYASRLGPNDTLITRNTSFYHLEDLSLWAGEDPNIWGWVSFWNMPRLKRLTFDGNFGEQRLKSFCDRHGTGLQYLQYSRMHYFPQSWHSMPPPIQPQPIPDLSDSCPVLEHFVVPPFLDPFSHKTAKWLDVWVSDRNSGEAEQVQNLLRTAKLPALKGMRLLPHSFLEDRHNLPLLFPPGLVSTSAETFAIQLSDVVIRHDVGEILYIRAPRAGDLNEDDWKASSRRYHFTPDGESDEESDEESDASDKSFIPEESDYDGSDYDESDDSDGSVDWGVHIEPSGRIVADIRDWELEDGLEVYSSSLDNL